MEGSTMRIRWRGLELPSRVASERCTMTADVPFVLEMTIENGRGYRTAEENAGREREIGVIPVDASFSPVVRVKYDIEETRVGQRTNYDRLVLEVWTNGTVGSQMAL